MTDSERLQALHRFGYTLREAAFLSLMALHSGYFLARQFAAFIGAERGGLDHAFIRKARRFGHIRSQSTLQPTNLHHLYARAVYAVLGEPDNRHRRRLPPSTIIRKLRQLDFVLAHPDRRYLVTQAEKPASFRAQPGIVDADLPSQSYGPGCKRYFVEKFPVWVNSASPPTVGFAYIAGDECTVGGFESFLVRYRPLLARLPHSKIIYVADSDRHVEAVRACFNRFLEVVEERAADFGSRLLQWFQLEQQLKAEQIRDPYELNLLARLRHEFEQAPQRSLLPLWQSCGDQAVLDYLDDTQAIPPVPDIRFSTYRLEERYDLFTIRSRAV